MITSIYRCLSEGVYVEYTKRIRNLREDADKTQYARYERGANELPIRHLISLCKYYDVSADYILGLSSKKKRI